MRKRRRGRRVSWVWVWLLPELREGKTEAEARRKVLEMVVVCGLVAIWGTGIGWWFVDPGLQLGHWAFGLSALLARWRSER